MTLPALPEPIANNAVAKIIVNNQAVLLSFMGLGAGKTHKDVHNNAWALQLNKSTHWQSISPVPHINPLAGRLASVAVGIHDQAYLFGGYTVAADHSEISTQDNYRYDFQTDQYHRIADMPVAVDDAALITYQDRYIYLLGGWHQHGNVNLVQVYDRQTDTWSQASPIPAPAVFGQSAGIVGNELVLCDGVTVQPQLAQARTFAASPICLYGKIQADNHLRIDWQSLPHYSVANSAAPSAKKVNAHYRMAATGIAKTRQILFIGGSDNPYNYNGIGYDGQPSSPSARMHRFDLDSHSWQPFVSVTQASMDHRGLIEHQEQVLRVGGMVEQQALTAEILATPIPLSK